MRDYATDAPSAPTRLWTAFLSVGVLVAVAAAALWLWWPEIAAWARETQATAQTALARGVRAVKAGDATAYWGLIGACAVYGFAHAVGPGHGKMLIGGAAAASKRTAWRMAAVGFAASLAQGLSAILIAYGAMGLMSVSGGWAANAAERVLAPASYVAIGLIGLWIAWRGGRGLRRLLRAQGDHAHEQSLGHDHQHAHPHAHPQDHPHDHPHDHGDHAHICDAGCRHGPSVAEIERADSWREIAALILSIGVRPCSGALIVLAIAWGYELYLLGALGAMAMAVGTGVVVAGVGLAAAWARDGAQLRRDDRSARVAFTAVQLSAGLLIAVAAFGLAATTLETPTTRPGLFTTR